LLTTFVLCCRIANTARAGILDSVDQYLNIKLNDISVVDPSQHPYLVSDGRVLVFVSLTCPPPLSQSSVKNCFVRGSTVRYIHIPKELVDVELLQDATRVEARESKKAAAER
jgi:U6 snRNA-associated Sm-like protein LSm2